MIRTLAGEGFRLERLPLRVTVRRGCYCALLRVRGCGCRPNGMELPLSLARGLSIMRHIVGARVDDNAVINDKRTSIPFCPKTDALTRKSEKNRNGQALTRERRPAKRNPHLASVLATQIFSDFLIRFSQISARSAPPLIRAAYYANSYAQRTSCKHKKISGHLSADLLFCETFGRQVGFEPTTHGTTIRYSNQLSYNRHLGVSKRRGKNTLFLDMCNTAEIFFLLLHRLSETCDLFAAYVK